MSSPSIIPNDRLDRDIYLVLEDFRSGSAWRETDEADTDVSMVVEGLLTGQYDRPLRVVAFNAAERWSRDATEDTRGSWRPLKIKQYRFVIDGEAVLLGVNGVSDFDALHSRQHDEEVQLYAFDLMATDGDDIRKLPLSARKSKLDRLLARRPDGIFVAPFEAGPIDPHVPEGLRDGAGGHGVEAPGRSLPSRRPAELGQGEEPAAPCNVPCEGCHLMTTEKDAFDQWWEWATKDRVTDYRTIERSMPRSTTS